LFYLILPVLKSSTSVETVRAHTPCRFVDGFSESQFYQETENTKLTENLLRM